MTDRSVSAADTHPVNLGKAVPAAYRALAELSKQAEQAAAESGLDRLLVELVKIRTSQLNGCAYCLRMHTRDAVTHGETADRLAVLPAWRESGYFSPAERAALALAERTTLLTRGEHGTADEAALDTAQTAAVHWLTVVMNAWNRVAITSAYRVAPEGANGAG